MTYFITFIIGFFLGYLIFSRKNKGNFISEQSVQKENNKRRILELLETKYEINNDEIQNHLAVSDASATRYLEELEKEGKVRQVGRAGKHVVYKKV